MDVKELRADLHNLIDKISDRDVLNAVKVLLSGKGDTNVDWWDSASEEERAEIEQGLAEDDKGEVTSHEKIREKYKKWL